MILGAVQPSYLAWNPYLERIAVSDTFIYLDDVEYSRNSFHNRNRIKSQQGELQLTVPVRYSANSRAFINEIEIDYSRNWQQKHLRSIQQAYSKAAYYLDVEPMVGELIMTEYPTLADLNIALLENVREYLGVKVRCIRSSDLHVHGVANEKLVNLCKHVGADAFIVKPGTEEYHPRELFGEADIDFVYFTASNEEYRQLYGEFVPGLSMIDYAFNCGPDSFYR